ncbi:hypothetical protein B0T16DRAFT_410804 [Cercophora newfieldiana]|uniref:Uncharacterized protein n=1 Tax=Cercophora newfieldiana TaxID=92897 RepID=A0AA40CSQ1_9PEZI|nr:hypothetical protein B0T16DRAFT_410804 [Cercophora newfieldiana]
MFTAISNLLGGRPPPAVPDPPPVTVTGVRIPANGSAPHLVPLTTTPEIKSGTDKFLCHTPDLRHYCGEKGWDLRERIRLDLLRDRSVPLSLHLQQQAALRQVLMSGATIDKDTSLHLRQRFLGPQRSFVLLPEHQHCAGAYYVFYSFAANDLPENESTPKWIVAGSMGRTFFGDAFLVKMAEVEQDENGWAVYEDIDSWVLEVLASGPSEEIGSAWCL